MRRHPRSEAGAAPGRHNARGDRQQQASSVERLSPPSHGQPRRLTLSHRRGRLAGGLAPARVVGPLSMPDTLGQHETLGDLAGHPPPPRPRRPRRERGCAGSGAPAQDHPTTHRSLRSSLVVLDQHAERGTELVTRVELQRGERDGRAGDEQSGELSPAPGRASRATATSAPGNARGRPPVPHRLHCQCQVGRRDAVQQTSTDERVGARGDGA